MRVLVTRPEPSAENTAAKLLQRGHQPVLLPLMRAHHQPEALRQALADVSHLPSALIVTSAEAMRVLAGASLDLSPLLALRLFAVGRTTAEAAGNLGFTRVTIGGGDGEALADCILADDKTEPDRQILYLAGTPRSSSLEEKLISANMNLAVAECYRMLPVDHHAERLKAALDPLPDVVLLYSAETARHFLSLPPVAKDTGRIKALRLLCLSEKIAETLPADLRPMAAWPPEPREDLLLDLI